MNGFLSSGGAARIPGFCRREFGCKLEVHAGLKAMDEKRTRGRQRVLKAATIEFGGGAIDCTIRNWSATGAALDVSSPVGIPAHFTLFVPADGRHWPCRVVWRKEKRIGVTFE
jgi:hypothetical protein